MSATLYRYEVVHPEYGRETVEADSPEGAVKAACRTWDVSWKEEAGYCRARRLGKAAKPRCRRCYREFGEPGDVKAYCPECERAMEHRRRELAGVRSTRRNKSPWD